MTQHQIQIIIEQICDENPKEIKYSIRRKLFKVCNDLETEHLKIIAEKDAEINALVLENDLLKQSQIPKQIKDFVDEAMYVLSLRKNKRFTNSELSKDKLFEMFEDILHKA